MSALERKPKVPAATPDEDLGPGTDRRGIPRSPSQLIWRLEFLGLNQGCHGPFCSSRGKVGFLSGPCRGKGPDLVLRGETLGFPRVETENLGFLSSYDGDLRDPLVLPQESQVSMRVERGLSGFLSCWCRVLGPHLELRPEPQGSSPVQTWISVFLWSFHRGVKPHLVWRHGYLLSSRAVKLV